MSGAVPMDELARVAARIAGAPIAVVTLTGRPQPWIATLADLADLARADTPGARAVRERVLSTGMADVITDVRDDDRFPEAGGRPGEIVEPGGIEQRFFGCFPLRTPEGSVLGCLSVISPDPVSLSPDQRMILQSCADQAGAGLHLRSELDRLMLTERQRDQELQRARDLFAGVINAATDTSIIANSMDGVCTVFSAGAERLLGYTAAEMVGTRRVIEIHDPAEVAARAQEMGIEPGLDVFHRHPRETGESETREWTYITKSGQRRLVTLTVGTMHDPAGNATGYIGVAQDITDSRRKDVELQQARDLFAGVINAATGTSIIASDLNGICTVFNSGAERLLGYCADEIVGTDRVGAFHDPAEVLARAEELGLPPGPDLFIKHVRDTGQTDTREWTYITKNGDRRRVILSISQTLSSEGRPTGFIGVAQDVTQERQAQREALEARDLFEQLLGAATDQAIIGIDLNGGITMFNTGAEQMLGYSRDEMIGSKPWHILRTPEELASISGLDDVDETYMAAFRQGVSALPQARSAMPGAERERPWTRKDGSRVIVQVSLTPMRDHTGQHQGYLAIATDMTEQRRAERDVQEAMQAIGQARDEAMAANAAKSRFLATMSHEIRTPMNAVIGMTGLLLETDLDADQQDLVETVRSSGDLLLAIINDILDFSKIEAGDLDLESRAFDLHDLVEGTMTQFAGSASGLDLVSYVDEECATELIGDVTRLRQVLSNLVGNAIKFTERGDVSLRVRRAGPSDDEPAGQITVLFEVRDTGIGIPAASMDRLFKSFSQVDASTTRTYGGTGLGLAISRALVTAMGGRIWVDSTPGAGSTFSFTVTLATGPSAGAAEQPATRNRPGLTSEQRRVLLAEDNATVRQIMQVQLERLGLATVLAEGPLDALEVLKNGSFDLAILDLTMPVLDGVQLATAIRLLPGHQRTPLILLSGIGRRHDDEAELFTAVLTKPVRRAALIESLNRALSPVAAVPVQTAGPGQLADGAGRKLRILLAEDNEVNQKVGRLMLGKLGHTVEIACTGADAVAAVHAQDYDVVLMDMHMPVMDGLEATRRIRAELAPVRQPPIIAMTASVTLEDREACAAAGMNGYLPKPIRVNDLAEMLRGVAPPARPHQARSVTRIGE